MPHKTTLLIPQKRLAMPFHVFRGYPCLSCPFVPIRGSNTTQATPFRVFRVFRGYPLPFVSIRGSYSPPLLFFVFFVVTPCFCPFVSIRVHSWFLLSPLLFSCISCFSWLTPAFGHSCPFVSIRGSYSLLLYLRVFRG